MQNDTMVAKVFWASDAAMAEWKFKRGERVYGPFTEQKIREVLEKQQLIAGDAVQSDQSPWRDAVQVRMMFRELYQFGWYIQRDGNTLGPFTPSRMLDMRGDALITKNTLVRQGVQGEWSKFADVHPAILQFVNNAAQRAAAKSTETAQPTNEVSQRTVSPNESVAETLKHLAEPMAPADATMDYVVATLVESPETGSHSNAVVAKSPIQVVPATRERKPQTPRSKNVQWLSKHMPYIVAGVLLLGAIGVVIKAYSPVDAVGEMVGEVRRSSVVTSIVPRREYDTEGLVSLTSPSVALVSAGPATGTGFVVGPQLLITNYHVVSDAEANSIEVTFPDGAPGSEGPFTAAVIAEAPSRDLALLKLPVVIPAVEIDESHQFRRGQEIVIIGSPGVFQGQDVLPNAVTRGVLSSQFQIDGFNNYQLSAAVNPGNSGGPVFGNDGRVIGVVVMKSISEESIAFCIPAGDLVAFIRENSSAISADPLTIRSRHNARRAVRVILEQSVARALVVRVIAERLESTGADLSRVAMRDLQDAEASLTGVGGILRQVDLVAEFGYLVNSPGLTESERAILAKVFDIRQQTDRVLDQPPAQFSQLANQIELDSQRIIDSITELHRTLDIGQTDLLNIEGLGTE